ncbi:hypothetical protein PINS_up010511 [Pythium insidiosum]|nr:hypothetical protein PINS_up010511 [Pythium insidiosum]
MNEFPHLCGWRSPLSPPSSMTSPKLRFPDEDPAPPPVGERRRRRRGVPSNARDSNLLEAINLVLNIFEKHHIDRHLSRSGQSVVILTAGNGIFSVNKRLAEITEQRMMDHGIGIDMISLATPPLHKCPLFLFKQTDSVAPTRGMGVVQPPQSAEPGTSVYAGGGGGTTGAGAGAGAGTGAAAAAADTCTCGHNGSVHNTSNARAGAGGSTFQRRSRTGSNDLTSLADSGGATATVAGQATDHAASLRTAGPTQSQLQLVAPAPLCRFCISRLSARKRYEVPLWIPLSFVQEEMMVDHACPLDEDITSSCATCCPYGAPPMRDFEPLPLCRMFPDNSLWRGGRSSMLSMSSSGLAPLPLPLERLLRRFSCTVEDDDQDDGNDSVLVLRRFSRDFSLNDGIFDAFVGIEEDQASQGMSDDSTLGIGQHTELVRARAPSLSSSGDDDDVIVSGRGRTSGGGSLPKVRSFQTGDHSRFRRAFDRYDDAVFTIAPARGGGREPSIKTAAQEDNGGPPSGRMCLTPPMKSSSGGGIVDVPRLMASVPAKKARPSSSTALTSATSPDASTRAATYTPSGMLIGTSGGGVGENASSHWRPHKDSTASSASLPSSSPVRHHRSSHDATFRSRSRSHHKNRSLGDDDGDDETMNDSSAHSRSVVVGSVPSSYHMQGDGDSSHGAAGTGAGGGTGSSSGHGGTALQTDSPTVLPLGNNTIAGDGIGAGNGAGVGELMDDLFTSHAYIYKQLTSNQRRWSQVRPRDDKNPYRLVQGVLKWKSLIFPALLPLTTDYIPGPKELKAHYTESFYSFTLPDRDDPMLLHHGAMSTLDAASAFRDYREYVMEMVAQRFSQDFQLVTIEREESSATGAAAPGVPAIGAAARNGIMSASDPGILTTAGSVVPSELPRGPGVARTKGKANGSVFWLSMGHRIHEIMYNEETQQVEVKRYHQRATARSDVDIMEYRYALWSPVADDFLFATQEFRKYPRIEYAWNMLDVLICGEQDSMIEGIRYKRIMHCIVPPLLHKDADQNAELEATNAQALQQYTDRCRKFFEFLRSKAEHPSAFPEILLSTELLDGQKTFGTGAFRQVTPYNIKIPLHSSDAPTRQNWVIVRVDTELLAAQCFHVEVQWMVCHSTLVDDFITTLVRRAKQLGLEFIAVPENGVSSDLDLHPLICPIFVPVRATSAQRIVEEALVHRFGFCAEGLHAIPHSHLNHSHEYAIVQQRRPNPSSLLQQQLAPRGSPPGHASTAAAAPPLGPASRLGGEHPYRRQTNYYRQYIHRSLACFVRVTQTGLVWISNRKLQCQVIQPIYVAIRELVNAVQASNSVLDGVMSDVVVSVHSRTLHANARRCLDMDALAEPASSPAVDTADTSNAENVEDEQEEVGGGERVEGEEDPACDTAVELSDVEEKEGRKVDGDEKGEAEADEGEGKGEEGEGEEVLPPQEERLSGDSDKENDASQNGPASGAGSGSGSGAGCISSHAAHPLLPAAAADAGCSPASAIGGGSGSSTVAAPTSTPNVSTSTLASASSSLPLKDPLSARPLAASHHHASTRQQLPFPQPM